MNLRLQSQGVQLLSNSQLSSAADAADRTSPDPGLRGPLRPNGQHNRVAVASAVEIKGNGQIPAGKLADQGKYLPAIAVAGGFTFEDQIFKGLAMGAPFVKLVGMARSPIAAAMVGKTIGHAIEQNQLAVYIERFGSSKDEIFVTASHLRKELGEKEFAKVPPGMIFFRASFQATSMTGTFDKKIRAPTFDASASSQRCPKSP